MCTDHADCREWLSVTTKQYQDEYSYEFRTSSPQDKMDMILAGLVYPENYSTKTYEICILS